MNLEAIPLSLTLFGKVDIYYLFGSETVYETPIWHYQTTKIEKEIFNVHTNEPDESPPQFMESSTPAVSPTLLCVYLYIFLTVLNFFRFQNKHGFVPEVEAVP